MSVKEKYRILFATQIIDGFAKRGVDGYYCATKEEAVKEAVRLLPKGCTVSCGGSETLLEIGLREALKSVDCVFWDPLSGKGGAEMDEIARRALSADYYFMSANAVTMSGELINADGYGNRVSALIYGPKHVVVIAGMNKVVKDVPAGFDRIKNIAAPMICLKFKPDAESFAEVAALAESAASQTVITSRSVTKGRISVILVGEPLGF
jgi:hypothetical protein